MPRHPQSPSCSVTFQRQLHYLFHQRHLQYQTTMIVPNDDVHLTSPSCVIEGSFKLQTQSRLKQKIQDDECLLASFGRRLEVNTVSFSQEVSELQSPWTLDDVEKQDIWYSLSDIDTFKKVARRHSKNFLRQHRLFTQTFNAMFQDCSRPDQRISELQLTDSVKTMMSFPADIRGLECRIIPLIKQYRAFHVQSVLSVKGESESFRRTRSMSTSRPSRAVARILASSDANEVVSIIREELDYSSIAGGRNGPYGREHLADNLFIIRES
jgi:hypothetical protein